jgi:hypothetical protein
VTAPASAVGDLRNRVIGIGLSFERPLRLLSYEINARLDNLMA